MATSRPKAVVMSASEMPADTEARPPEPEAAISWKAVMMPSTVPSSPTNGDDEATVARPERPRRRSAVTRRVARSTERLMASTRSNSPTSCGPCLASASRPLLYSAIPAPRTRGMCPYLRVVAYCAASSIWWPGSRSRSFSAYLRLWSLAREKLNRRSAITLSE